MSLNIIDQIALIQRGDKDAAICVVVNNKGSTPRKVGAKMIVYENGQIEGTIGGGNLEKTVIENALIQINKKEAKLFTHNLLTSHKMCCGGIMQIFIEPIMKINKLLIFGAGHTGLALAKIAAQLQLDVHVYDDRKDKLDLISDRTINTNHGRYEQQLEHIKFDKNTYIVILTYDHAFDRGILAHCLQQPYAYLGLIGSKRKINLSKKMLLENKIANIEDIENVDMPMGIDINAITPEEIAISILAKIIDVKNR